MSNYNSIILEGNLVKDPEMRTTPKGVNVCNFSLASNRYFSHEGARHSEVSFFEVETWASLAMWCDRDLGKGRGVKIVGRLKQDRWVDKEGKNHSKVKIVADHVEPKPRFSSTEGGEKEKAEEKEKESETVF